MIRSKLVIGMLTALFICGGVQVFAGEIPPGYKLAPKDKLIMGQGTIIKIDDYTIAYVIIGTCKKQPFQIGPVIETTTFDTITEDTFDQQFFYATVPAKCKPSDGYIGNAIVGFDNLFFLNDVISGEAILQAVVPASQ